MSLETRKKILKAMTLLEELSEEKDVIKILLFLEKRGDVLNVDPQKRCTGTNISQLGGNYVLP